MAGWTVDSFAWVATECLTAFCGLPRAEAERRAGAWRAANPAGSQWTMLGEDHVEPLTVACALAQPEADAMALLTAENAAWDAHREQYNELLDRAFALETAAHPSSEAAA